MITAIDTIKANLFSVPMPDMPPTLKEIWQVAFMYRRKYANPRNKDPEAFFAQALSDAHFIAECYGNCETVQSLLMEVYIDIERQFNVEQARAERDGP